VHHRPVALVSVLAVGDYLLWNWSLQGNHDVLALISGLTLVLLAISLLWLVALNAGRLLRQIAQRPTAQRTAQGRAAPRSEQHEAALARAEESTAQQQRQRKGGEPASSSKLAA
jgi:Na+-transporting methylmalonyl-CoA/oxaloacetate decarboxylase gamma subunit